MCSPPLRDLAPATHLPVKNLEKSKQILVREAGDVEDLPEGESLRGTKAILKSPPKIMFV